MKMINERQAEKIKELYSEGWNDAEIIRRANVNQKQVAEWRKINNLPKNKKPIIIACEILYQRGMIDDDIARAVGSHESAVAKWRMRNHLPANGERGYGARRRRALDMLWGEIEELYFGGVSDQEIAKKMHINTCIVENWRKIMCLPEVWDVKNIIEKDSESLFCDGAFLEKITGKPIKPC